MNLLKHERRFFATLIDGLVIFILTLILSIVFKKVLGFSIYKFDYFFYFLFCFLMFIYQFLSMFFLKNKTLGMLIFKTRIFSSSWEYLSIKQILLRSISISIPILFVINLLYIVINREQTTIFDKISDSIVIEIEKVFLFNKKKDIE